MFTYKYVHRDICTYIHVQTYIDFRVRLNINLYMLI